LQAELCAGHYIGHPKSVKARQLNQKLIANYGWREKNTIASSLDRFAYNTSAQSTTLNPLVVEMIMMRELMVSTEGLKTL
jgi:hypothetical protein